MPVVDYGRPQNPVTDLLSQEQHDRKSEDFKQHAVKLVDKSTFQGNEEPAESTLLKASTAIVPEISNVPVPEINMAIARMYDHHKSREPHDSSLSTSNNPGRVSPGSRVKVSAVLSAALEGSHRCDRSQAHNDMASEEAYSDFEPRSPKIASSTGQHIEASAISQQLRMNNGKHPMYAPVTDDTKNLESPPVQATTACVPQNRSDNTSVQAAYGVQIDDHSRAEGSEKAPGGHVMKWAGRERSSSRPGTSISILLSPVSPTSSKDIKDDESTTVGKDSVQASSRTLAHVEFLT